MVSDAKRVGSTFETDTLGYLRERGAGAERLARTGKLDEGDLSVVIGDQTYVIECKARRDRNSSLNLGSWLGEAARESEHYATARSLERVPTALLLVKNPGKSIGQAFVVQHLEDWIGNRSGSIRTGSRDVPDLFHGETE